MYSNDLKLISRTFLRAMESVMVTGEHGLDLSAGGSSMTFFVPTDAAFQELGAGTVESALKNPVLLKTVN